MFRSVRFKLTVWYTSALALIIIAFSLLVYTFFVRTIVEQTDKNIVDMSHNLIASIQGEESDLSADPSTDESVVEALTEFRSRDFQFVIVKDDGSRLVAQNVKAAEDLRQTAFDAAGFGNITIGGEPFRVHQEFFRLGSNNYGLYTIYSRSAQIDLENRVKGIFAVAAPIALLLAAFGGYLLAKRTLSPIAAMSCLATRITAANLNERIPIANSDDELGKLAAAFNGVFDRLDKEFERQRNFMADASHELRTPIAIIRGESEIALSDVNRPSDEYLSALRIVNDESSRMSGIVEDLFLLARNDAGQLKAAGFTDMYLDEVVIECIRTVRSLASQKNIHIEFLSDETLIAGNEELLKRLFINLLDNAVKYNIDGGTISVSIKDRTVSIANTGAEIPETLRGHIFERFVRARQSRSYDEASFTSGAGLGLSIVKVIAALHHATVSYSRSENDKNIFSVVFPN